MVDRQTRMKKKRFRKTPGGRTVAHYSRSDKSYAECAVTGKQLHGTGNQDKAAVGKQSRTGRRPSVKFGGILSGEARKELWENFALVEGGVKKINEVPVRFRKFIEVAKVAQK